MVEIFTAVITNQPLCQTTFYIGKARTTFYIGKTRTTFYIGKAGMACIGGNTGAIDFQLICFGIYEQMVKGILYYPGSRHERIFYSRCITHVVILGEE